MLESQIQILPNPSLKAFPTQRDSETKTATAQGDRAYDNVRDQRLWEPTGVNPVQGRRDPVGFLEEVHPSGYLVEKLKSV